MLRTERCWTTLPQEGFPLKNNFEGTYYKHQKGSHTLCLICGRYGADRFIQVITNHTSYQLPFTQGNQFTSQGIRLDIHTEALTLTGQLSYHQLTPIRYDIMGPFRYFPMECSHGIVSMRHQITGAVVLNGEEFDFTGGIGYIETDRGVSFPSSYLWVQANDFSRPCSIMASVARIPFWGAHFQGCICVVYDQGREYRLATYLGGKALCCNDRRLVLHQGKLRLEIEIGSREGHLLQAPSRGGMNRTITEAAAIPARFRFFRKGQLLFDLSSRQTSFEYEMEQ